MGVVKPEHKGRGADAKAGRIKPWFAPISRALYRPGPRGQAPVAPLASKSKLVVVTVIWKRQTQR
jgi:hypothetical protein